MALPWLRLIDVAFGLNDVVRRVRSRNDPTDEPRALATTTPSALGGIEARLAGVVVSALKEAFDRDHQRLELEREKLDAERARAERALKLELLRQAGEREISRMRMVAATALAGWVTSVALSFRVAPAGGGRFMLGAAWALLLIGLVATYAEQVRLSRTIAVADERRSVESATASGVAGVAAPWLVAAGFAAAAVAALI